jgi:hypothetical protein
MTEKSFGELNRCNDIQPESIEIVGAKENNNQIYEADVMFSDVCKRKWYMTIVSGDQFIYDTLKEFDSPDVDAIINPGEEPGKFVWNGPLNEDRIKTIIGSTGTVLLMPYLVSVDETE